MKAVIAAVTLASLCGNASAFEFRCRFVERIGNTDVVVPGNFLEPTPGQVYNFRLQMGVFDDAAGAAPAGGFLGWNVGTVAVSGPVNNSDERRNPGRLSPFNFATGPNANGNPPLPGGDPFTMLTDIDATLGTQSPTWVCNAQGVAPPQPAAVIRGRNTFVSVFAFSMVVPSFNFQGHTITFGGNLIAASGWQTIGTPTPPDCGDPANPGDDVAGSVTYAPLPLTPQAFTCVLQLPPPPTPSAGMTVVLGLLGASSRRRR